MFLGVCGNNLVHYVKTELNDNGNRSFKGQPVRLDNSGGPGKVVCWISMDNRTGQKNTFTLRQLLTRAARVLTANVAPGGVTYYNSHHQQITKEYALHLNDNFDPTGEPEKREPDAERDALDAAVDALDAPGPSGAGSSGEAAQPSTPPRSQPDEEEPSTSVLGKRSRRIIPDDDDSE